jgi:hypothetical protein
MTFDVAADVYVSETYGWRSHHELAVVCRRCRGLSVLKVSLRDHTYKGKLKSDDQVRDVGGDITVLFESRGFLSVADITSAAQPPEHLPADVEAAFREATKCLAVGCQNAAASMFRLALDLTTKPLLPDQEQRDVPQPTKEQRFKLGNRIDWLIEQGKIAPELSRLAHCVRQNSNDGVHDGSLEEKDAEDLLDFTIALLERHFTEPERLRLAELRFEERRGKPAREARSSETGTDR